MKKLVLIAEFLWVSVIALILLFLLYQVNELKKQNAALQSYLCRYDDSVRCIFNYGETVDDREEE